MGTWLWAIVLLNGQKAGSCGWMFRRVPVTGLTGQIFGCFRDYNNWTSAGEGVGTHVRSPSMDVGCAIIPSGFTSSCRALESCGLFGAGAAPWLLRLGTGSLCALLCRAPGAFPRSCWGPWAPCSGDSCGWLSLSPPCPRWVRSGSQEFV